MYMGFIFAWGLFFAKIRQKRENNPNAKITTFTVSDTQVNDLVTFML